MLGFSLTLAVIAASVMADVTDPTTPRGLVLDFANLAWWQALLGVIFALGLSPAPWITGLAMGRLQFAAAARRDFERQLREQVEMHGRELGAKDVYYGALLDGKDQRYADLKEASTKNAEAAERERRRADEVTDAALDMTEALQASTHVIASVNQIAREAVSDEHP